MPSYRLIYFSGRGRAEPARIIMAYGGIEYEDVRIEGAQWPDQKHKYPWGQLPVLEIDGEMICQSNAIFRYVAKQAGLMGDSDLDVARIDMILGCCDDYAKDFSAIFREPDEERKKVLHKKFQEGLPVETAKLEKLLKGDYYVGNKLSLADIAVSCVLTMPVSAGFEIKMDDFPNLKAMQNKVFTEPKIAAWIKKRPETPM